MFNNNIQIVGGLYDYNYHCFYRLLSAVLNPYFHTNPAVIWEYAIELCCFVCLCCVQVRVWGFYTLCVQPLLCFWLFSVGCKSPSVIFRKMVRSLLFFTSYVCSLHMTVLIQISVCLYLIKTHACTDILTDTFLFLSDWTLGQCVLPPRCCQVWLMCSI